MVSMLFFLVPSDPTSPAAGVPDALCVEQCEQPEEGGTMTCHIVCDEPEKNGVLISLVTTAISAYGAPTR